MSFGHKCNLTGWYFNRSSEYSHIFIYDISKYCQNLLLTVYNRWQRCSCICHYRGHDTRLCLQELPADEYNEREILPGWMLDPYGEGVRWLCCDLFDESLCWLLFSVCVLSVSLWACSCRLQRTSIKNVCVCVHMILSVHQVKVYVPINEV